MIRSYKDVRRCIGITATILLLALVLPVGVSPTFAAQKDATANYWWYCYPTFTGVDSLKDFTPVCAMMDEHSDAQDPTWGPFTQRSSALDLLDSYREFKTAGARVITWIEGFGDVMLYVAALDRNGDGSFVMRKDDPTVASIKRTAWNWASFTNPPGNTARWVGIHNVVNDEDFTVPAFSHEKLGLKLPTYPDGKSAVGYLKNSEWPYPLNAAVYDACAAKDISGHIEPELGIVAGANEIDKTTGKPKGPIEGLFPATIGKNGLTFPGLKDGDPVYCGTINVHKDLSAPFWRDYVRLSVRALLKQGFDGVWCDNYSPWDNFGYNPVKGAFGEWSLYGFREYLRSNFSNAGLRALGISDPATFDVRDYLKKKAASFGAKDPSNLDDKVWTDGRWLDEPIWGMYKASRQTAAQRDLRAFYNAIHDEARKAGRPDFCVRGNDIPFFSLGWVRDDYLDMVDTEITAGWHMGSGSRGITLLLRARWAPSIRRHTFCKRDHSAPHGYYVNGKFDKYKHKPGLSKVLESEAFSNAAFLLCAPSNTSVCGADATQTCCGTAESHAWLNKWVKQNTQTLGVRKPLVQVGILFSPDNQLQFMTPHGFADMDKQPNMFGYYGWATALVDGHIPYLALADWR